METLNIPKYDLKEVEGRVCMTREVVIPPFATIVVKGAAKLITHSKHISVVIEPYCGLLRPHCHSQLFQCLETGSRHKKSECKVNHFPKMDCCGKDCSIKCHSGSVGTKRNIE